MTVICASKPWMTLEMPKLSKILAKIYIQQQILHSRVENSYMAVSKGQWGNWSLGPKYLKVIPNDT